MYHFFTPRRVRKAYVVPLYSEQTPADFKSIIVLSFTNYSNVMNYFTLPLLKSEVKILPILRLFLLFFCSVSAMAQNPLTPAKKFNLFLQGNATLSSNESEGPVVIGGNLTVAGSYKVNINGSNYNDLFTIGGNKIGLAVRGGVTYNSGTLQVNGQSFAKIGNCTSPQASVASGSGGIAEVNPSGNPGATPRILINTAQPTATVCDNVFGNGTDKIDIDAAFVSFKQCSPSFGTKTNNVAIGDQNGNAIPGLTVDGTGYYSDASLVQSNPKITLDPNAINVLNVTGDFWTALGANINFQNVPQSGSGALIINFKTGGTYNFVMPSNGGTNGGTAAYTLFNFPNATTLSVGGAELNGSVFAPFADITHIGTNNIQGQVIGQSYISSGEELHQYPFVPNLGSCGNTPVCNAPTPTGTGAARCGEGTVSLTASGCTTGFTAKWFTDAAGNSAAAGSNSGNSYTTPSISATTDYYVLCQEDAKPTCKSATTKITATVAPKPTISGSPVVTQATCKADGTAANNDAKIVISGITNGSTYTVDGGSSQTLSGATISLENLANPSASKTYVIKIFNSSASDCFLEVTAVLEPKVCTPTCTPPSPTGQGTTVCSGSTATISATGCDATYVLKWYSDAALSNEITSGTSGNNLTTGSLTATTDYYAACVKSADCKSAGTKITATVKPLPNFSGVQTICASGNSTYSVTITSNGIVTVKSPSGTSISGTSTYTISGVISGQNLVLTSTLNGCPKDTTILAPGCGCTPVTPTALAANVGICEGATPPDPTFTAIVGSNTTVDWYANATGGTPLKSNSLTFTATAPGTYYIQAKSTDQSCNGEVNTTRVPVTLAVNPKPVFKIVATDPTCDGKTALNNGKVVISVGTAGQKYAFNSTGTSSLPTTASNTTTTIGALPTVVVQNIANNTASTTYYVRVFSNEGCFKDTSATVNPKVCEVACIKPNAGPDQLLVCSVSGTTTADLVDAPTGQKWKVLSVQPNTTVKVTTPEGLVSGMTLPGQYRFVLQTQSDSLACRDTVNVTIPECACPTVNVLTPNAIVCKDSLFTTLTVAIVGSNTQGVGAAWYANATGGASLGTGLSFKPTGTASVTDTFYVQLTGVTGACAEAARTEVIVAVQNCAKFVDLALKKGINTKIAKIGDELIYTIRVFSQPLAGSVNATGVEVTDSIATTVQFVVGSFVASRGSAVISGNVIRWTIGGIAANAGVNSDTVTLTYKVKATMGGVHFNTAEISKTNEKDVDSTPGNGKDSEDDLDRQCFTVPFTLCPGEKVRIMAPSNLTNVVWSKAVNGQTTAAGSGNEILVSEVGSYSFTATNKTCPASGCCPVIIEPGTNCCPAELCVPFTVKRIKKK